MTSLFEFQGTTKVCKKMLGACQPPTLIYFNGIYKLDLQIS
jgi:hypothetical protein